MTLESGMIKSELEEDIVVIEVVLPSLHQRAEELRETVRKYVSGGRRKFVLHILGGNHITSIDIGVLISVYANIKRTGGDVAMYTEDEAVRRVLPNGCFPSYRIFNNRREAIEYFGSAGRRKFENNGVNTKIILVVGGLILVLIVIVWMLSN